MKKIGLIFLSVILPAALYACAANAEPSPPVLETEKELYRQALSLQPHADSLGFEGFRLADHPIAVFTGGQDYVLQGDRVISREPVLDGFYGTVYEVNGRYEAFVPAWDELQKMISGTGAELTGSTYVAMLWHEGFHAWQLTHYNSINEIYKGLMSGEITFDLEGLDENASYRQLFLSEQRSLAKAIEAETLPEVLNLLYEWAELAEQYDGLMTETHRLAVDFFEMLEGSAYTVESQIYARLEGEQASKERYLHVNADYNSGNFKYYKSGMMKLLLIERLNPNWQDGFSAEATLNTMLMELLGL